MISYLKGIIIEKKTANVVLDIHGVGYQAGIPLSTYLKLGEAGEEASLYIHTHVTDSSLSLFGFSTRRERELFLKLIGISGIGPKIALNILSGIGVSDLEQAISSSDISRLSLIPGIGKKTAMRIALELQEKLGVDALDKEYHQSREDLISAMMNMGFKRKEIEKICDSTIKDLGDEADFDQLLRESLRRLAKL
jgi:Holliday junction DNA helicase RuvA